jgi:hypothetical protein
MKMPILGVCDRNPYETIIPVYVALKETENFRDLSTLADCDTDKYIDAARKLVCRLYTTKKVMACAAGKMLHKTGLRMLQIECTGMKTPILGVCDRTRMKP